MGVFVYYGDAAVVDGVFVVVRVIAVHVYAIAVWV